MVGTVGTQIFGGLDGWDGWNSWDGWDAETLKMTNIYDATHTHARRGAQDA